MLNIIMLNVIMPSVIMPSVIMLSVVAPNILLLLRHLLNYYTFMSFLSKYKGMTVLSDRHKMCHASKSF
jgi:hypothetical protein